jgi:hypothetical protein
LDAFNKDRTSLQQAVPAQQPAATLPPPDPRTQEMINEKLKKAEELGEQGMVDEAQKALEEAEALKKLTARQEPVVDSTKYTAADVRITDQKLRLCDICGAFLSVYDRLFGPSFTRITFAANKCAFFLDLLCLLEINNGTLNYIFVTNLLFAFGNVKNLLYCL